MGPLTRLIQVFMAREHADLHISKPALSIPKEAAESHVLQTLERPKYASIHQGHCWGIIIP